MEKAAEAKEEEELIPAYRYQRHVIDDGIHGYGRTLWEIAIPMDEKYVVANEDGAFFAPEPRFQGLVERPFDFYGGLTQAEICAATDAQLKHIRDKAKADAKKKDQALKEESKKKAERIQVSVTLRHKLVNLAHVDQQFAKLKQDVMRDLSSLLPKSRGYAT